MCRRHLAELIKQANVVQALDAQRRVTLWWDERNSFHQTPAALSDQGPQVLFEISDGREFKRKNPPEQLVAPSPEAWNASIRPRSTMEWRLLKRE
jgi:hypothetical protein